MWLIINKKHAALESQMIVINDYAMTFIIVGMIRNQAKLVGLCLVSSNNFTNHTVCYAKSALHIEGRSTTWQPLREFVTHQADRFLILERSGKMLWTRSLQISNVLCIFDTFIRLSFITQCLSVTECVNVTATGLQGQGLLFRMLEFCILVFLHGALSP